MKILVCIDDTDDLESIGTGELAEMLAADIERQGWGKCSAITRHQLLVHPDIPYTSHNSAMCFEADIESQYLNTFIKHAGDFLEKQSAPGSDPGLSVVVVDLLADPELLLDFGQRAKKQVMVKEEAYELAGKLQVHLSEHGGTGQGVIGALAGAGLRLNGNDGRIKGKVQINTAEDGTARVGEILRHTKADLVRSLDGEVLADNERVLISEWLKLVRLEGKAVLLVCKAEPSDGREQPLWRGCSKQQLKDY